MENLVRNFIPTSAMEVDYLERQVTFQVNQVRLTGKISIPKKSELLVVLILGEKEEKFWERFTQLIADLNESNIATLFLQGLLTLEEKDVSANRLDETLLADRLVSVTRSLRMYPETENHKIAYLSLSSIAGRIFRATSILSDGIESLVMIGNGLQPLNFVFCKTPILNVIGSMDFRGIQANKLVLSKIDSPVKRIQYIQGSPSNFEEKEKWVQVTETIRNWFLLPESRISNFADAS